MAPQRIPDLGLKKGGVICSRLFSAFQDYDAKKSNCLLGQNSILSDKKIRCKAILTNRKSHGIASLRLIIKYDNDILLLYSICKVSANH